MTRQQLIIYADRFLALVNEPLIDSSELEHRLLAVVAQDLVTPLTYPGAKSGFVGVKEIIQKLHGSLTEYSLKVVNLVVDEQQSSVVYFVKSAGVQTG